VYLAFRALVHTVLATFRGLATVARGVAQVTVDAVANEFVLDGSRGGSCLLPYHEVAHTKPPTNLALGHFFNVVPRIPEQPHTGYGQVEGTHDKPYFIRAEGNSLLDPCRPYTERRVPEDGVHRFIIREEVFAHGDFAPVLLARGEVVIEDAFAKAWIQHVFFFFNVAHRDEFQGDRLGCVDHVVHRFFVALLYAEAYVLHSLRLAHVL